MKAMILAAGLGTRLRPITNAIPKPLLPLGGRPLIEWNLLLLRRHGVREVIINVHHLGEQIEQALGDGSRLGMALRFSREPVILGTGGGLKQAASFFGREPFLVLNGDTVVDLDLEAVRMRHEARGAVATMVLREDPDVERWGPVDVDPEQRILRINGRGRRDGGAVTRLMFAGIHVMDERLLHHIPAGKESSVIDAYVQALEAGAVIFGHRMTGYWSDIGTVAAYEQAQRDVENGLVRLSDRER